MLGWLIGSAGLVLAAIMWLRRPGGLAHVPVALPPSPLVERLRPLLVAIDELRALGVELTAEDLQRCAPMLLGAELSPGGAGSALVGADQVELLSLDGHGPGPQRFMAVHRALAAVEPDDRQTLAEAGFDLVRLSAALEPQGPAEPWRAQLWRACEALEKTLGQVRHQPYR
ncbi:MAG: hypothetical protein KDK70_26275 [Myxococcales bacterium]|nr:hypothetical protein [Myxococcales bacterium]